MYSPSHKFAVAHVQAAILTEVLIVAAVKWITTEGDTEESSRMVYVEAEAEEKRTALLTAVSANLASPDPPPTMLIIHTLIFPWYFFASASNVGAVDI